MMRDEDYFVILRVVCELTILFVPVAELRFYVLLPGLQKVMLRWHSSHLPLLSFGGF
jgi:hypothetical protein